MVLDGGNALMAAERTPTGMGMHALEQRQLKANLIAEAYALAGIDGFALGAQDWTLGTEWVLETVKKHELPVLAANLVCQGKEPFPGHAIVEREGRKIGVIGVTYGPVDGCEVTNVHQALIDEAKAMGEVDVSVALVPGVDLREVGQAIEPALPIDLIFDGRGRHSHARPEQISGVYTFGAGSRGKSLGIVRLDWEDGATGWGAPIPVDDMKRRLASTEERRKMAETRAAAESDPDRKQRWSRQVTAYDSQIAQLKAEIGKAKGDAAPSNLLKGEEVDLNREVADHPATRALVDAAKDKMSAVAGDPKKHMPPQRAPADSVYAGAENCRGCHPAEYTQWAQTPHATALQSLVDDKRHMDDQCFSCHVTGAKQPGGPAVPTEVFGLRDVQCEACHGPARAHMTHPEDASKRPSKAPDQSTCVTCHDGEQDEGRFDYPSYLPKVVHKGPTADGHGAHDGHGH